jgi:hypothetical protein
MNNFTLTEDLKKLKSDLRVQCCDPIKLAQEYKLKQGCYVCGYSQCGASLAFHHMAKKSFSIPVKLMNLSNRGIDGLIDEIYKCVVLCTNCHMEFHELERKRHLV